jgi:hypothetical protein
MTTAHRIHHELYSASKILKDPGDGLTIRVTEDLQICEMVTGASNETRTLADPTKQGIRFVLRLLTDGGGDAVVTAAGTYNGTHTVATFAEASDILSLISVTYSTSDTGFRWDVLEGNVGVTLA